MKIGYQNGDDAVVISNSMTVLIKTRWVKFNSRYIEKMCAHNNFCENSTLAKFIAIEVSKCSLNWWRLLLLCCVQLLLSCIVLHSLCVFCLWSHLLFRCSFQMFVLCCCMRKVISMFKPFSVGSYELLVRVVSHNVIFCLMCSGRSLHVFCLLECGVCLLVELCWWECCYLCVGLWVLWWVRKLFLCLLCIVSNSLSCN